MVQENSIKIITVCGATATGKSDVAVELAKRLSSEVISADSMLVYEGFNVGTAKPTAADKQGVKHHLIDVCKGDETFSVSDYERLAAPIADGLINDLKAPIICGGTGFYINSLLFDLSYGNAPADASVREKYNGLARTFGNGYVYGLLTEKDPETASKLHENDIKRVIRALEIFDVTGKKKSDISDGNTIKRHYAAFAIDFDREQLYKRINERVEIMFERGLVDEVTALKDGGLDLSNQSMQGIGYKEFFDYFDGSVSLETVKENIKLNTRHYAKRQITFFKRLENLTWLKPDTAPNLADKIIEIYNKSK